MVNLTATDLNLLVALEALLEDRSVTQAGKRIGLSQPAMSAALRRLRILFGDELFVRSGRGVSPTPRALDLAVAVRAGLAQLRRALEGEARFDPASSERTFRLAMTDYAEWLFLAPLMRSVEREAPRIQLHIRRLDRLFHAPEDELRSGAIDMAIGFFGDARTLQKGTLSETLVEENNVVITRRSRRGRMTLDAFTSASHAAIIYRPEPWGIIDQELAARGRKRQLRLAVPHFRTVLDAVAQSDLIACVPQILAERHRQALGLRLHPVPLNLPPFLTRMIWHGNAREDGALLWLQSRLRNLGNVARRV